MSRFFFFMFLIIFFFKKVINYIKSIYKKKKKDKIPLELSLCYHASEFIKLAKVSKDNAPRPPKKLQECTLARKVKSWPHRAIEKQEFQPVRILAENWVGNCAADCTRGDRSSFPEKKPRANKVSRSKYNFSMNRSVYVFVSPRGNEFISMFY